jgi:type VI secretion system secreted protein VgrG
VAQQISVDITINGKEISPFSYLSLRQQFNGHHYFELRFNHDVLEAQGTLTLDKSKAFLGKNINIAFNNFAKTKTEHVFKGLVTDIRISNSQASPGDIIFSGYSPTILLETGETNQSHLVRSLNQVVKDTASHVPANDLSINIKPAKTSPIPYIVQYRESNFAFIRRLAAEYGEHFFYDGSALNFGKPAQADNLSLQYPNDISDLNLQVRLAPVSFEEISYLSKEDKHVNSPSSGQQVAGLDAFGKHALSTSEQVFQAKSSTLSRRKFKEAKELDESVKIAKSSSAANLVMLHASSDSPFVKLGGIVQVAASETDYGSFTVISVNHYTDGLGNYHNEFEAIPATVAVMPNPYDQKPDAEPQIGIVTDNKDPDNLGKVKVKLLWQKDTATTPFIRVLTPHGGNYGDGKKTRGQFFTPEINEHVIVGFTQNDPDRPFVMGSLPHGKAIDSAPNSDNHIKSISTRSGNIISFFDKEKNKEREIRIQTDDTNYISINLKSTDGTIKIFSSKAIEVQSAKTIHVKSENITVEATDSIIVHANKKIELKATDILIEGSKTFDAKGGSTAKVASPQTEISGSANAKVKGGILDLEGSSVANLKAAIVKIN